MSQVLLRKFVSLNQHTRIPNCLYTYPINWENFTLVIISSILTILCGQGGIVSGAECEGCWYLTKKRNLELPVSTHPSRY